MIITHKNNKQTTMKKNIITIANIIAFVSTTLLLTSCDTGGEDDGTVGNWFMAIVCLLAWLRGGGK
jgi:hypothetical protein